MLFITHGTVIALQSIFHTFYVTAMINLGT